MNAIIAIFRRFFPIPTVESTLVTLTKAIDRLDAVGDRNLDNITALNVQIEQAQTKIAGHEREAVKAIRVSAKLRDLLA